MRRYYSKVTISYNVQNLSIQQESYDKMCIPFTEAKDLTIDNESNRIKLIRQSKICPSKFGVELWKQLFHQQLL